MISKHIASLGVELECGINDDELHDIFDYAQEKCIESFLEFVNDGSVEVNDKEIEDGEILFWNEDKDVIKNFLKEAYRNGIRVNDTCGFHIHIKFTDSNIGNLFGFRKVQNCFYHLYREKHAGSIKYMNRLKDRFCRDKYKYKMFKHQIESKTDKSSRRYTGINLNSLNIHGTLEFRIFPRQATSIEAIGTIDWLIDTIETIITKFENEKLDSVRVDENTIKNPNKPRVKIKARHFVALADILRDNGVNPNRYLDDVEASEGE